MRSTRVLPPATSPPDRRVRTLESPPFRWPLTDNARPAVRDTLWAEADATPGKRQTHVGSASRTVMSTFIGTEDPTIWLAGVSRNYTVQVGRPYGVGST